MISPSYRLRSVKLVFDTTIVLIEISSFNKNHQKFKSIFSILISIWKIIINFQINVSPCFHGFIIQNIQFRIHSEFSSLVTFVVSILLSQSPTLNDLTKKKKEFTTKWLPIHWICLMIMKHQNSWKFIWYNFHKFMSLLSLHRLLRNVF